MKRARAVIGANFGDEGKGLMTDYFCSKAADRPLVVRHNGGAQAGHTVARPGGPRHVFHHLCSGTLLGADTFLSRFFVSNPILFREEHAELQQLVDLPIVYVDPGSPVTTPWDMVANQIIETSRASLRHGSCGIGFNETISRDAVKPYRLRVGDLFCATLPDKIRMIADEYAPARLQCYSKSAAHRELRPKLGENEIKRFLEDCAWFKDQIVVCPSSLLRQYEDVIFEGAQGLLLNQDHEWFPHVTRSHTGVRNAVMLCQETGIDALDVTYVSRSYMTRHGEGPFPCEPLDVEIDDRTNVPNPFQGELRVGAMNFDLLRNSICDDAIAIQFIEGNVDIAFTCLDQVDMYSCALPIPTAYVSRGPHREDVEEL